MGDTVFDFSVRTLECENCGAPVTGAVAGGQVSCQYCGTQLLISARQHEKREQTQIAEPARLAGLRSQLGSFNVESALLRAPEELAPFRPMLADPASRPAGEEGYRQQWERARGQLASGATGSEDEMRLFRLALALAEHYATTDSQRARAVFETAIDLLGDGELRDVLRCRIARHALMAGDIKAGQAWLGEVDVRPLRLEVDTEVRVALALLAFRNGEFPKVLEILGRDIEGKEVPMHLHQGGLLPWLLRAHALVGIGEQGAAMQLMQRVGRFGFCSPTEIDALFAKLAGPMPVAAAHQALDRGKRRMFTKLGGSGLVLVAAIVVPCCIPPACPVVACGGGVSAAIERLNSCKETRELLGDNITWAFGCHNGEGNCDVLDWEMAVKGSKDRGTATIRLRRGGSHEPWRVSGKITTDEGSANICTQR